MSVDVWIVLGVFLFYSLILLGTLPFLVYFGKPKPWQKAAQFLMSFPLDNEKCGFFSFNSSVAFLLLNGLIWGICVLGLMRLTMAIAGIYF
jgi:hypothetical protein